MVGGSIRHVPMSEPLSLWSRMFAEDRTAVRSIGVRNGEVVARLRSSGADQLPTNVVLPPDSFGALAAEPSPLSDCRGVELHAGVALGQPLPIDVETLDPAAAFRVPDVLDAVSPQRGLAFDLSFVAPDDAVTTCRYRCPAGALGQCASDTVELVSCSGAEAAAAGDELVASRIVLKAVLVGLLQPALPTAVEVKLKEVSPCATDPSIGLAFSATRQRLYAIGGLDDGQPANAAWLHDLGDGAWRRFEVVDVDPVGPVLAAVYRHEDMALYFLDEAGASIRLRRWQAQRTDVVDTVQTLATFPARWSGFGQYDLVAGPGGDLLLAAWNENSPLPPRYGLIDVAPNGDVDLVAVHDGSLPIMSRPLLTSDGVHVVERPAPLLPAPHGIPAGAFIAVTAFLAPTPLDEPTLPEEP